MGVKLPGINKPLVKISLSVKPTTGRSNVSVKVVEALLPTVNTWLSVMASVGGVSGAPSVSMLVMVTVFVTIVVLYAVLTWLLVSTTWPMTLSAVSLKVSRFGLPAASLNLPAATPMLAVPMLLAVGVKLAV